MKYFQIIYFIMAIYIVQEEKLKGAYKINYDEKYSLQNGVIIFNDSIYERKLQKGGIINGKITYKKNSISLIDNQTGLTMEFSKRHLKRDTIGFSTREPNIRIDDGKIILDSGKLIKIN